MSSSVERSVRGWVLGSCLCVLGVAALTGVRAVPGSGANGGDESSAAGISARHRSMIASIERGEARVGELAACFAPGTPEGVIEAFIAAMDRVAPDRFQQTTRWGGTVASGPAGGEGEPITLTYSFVPDGTLVPSGIGEGSGVSSLFAWLDGRYGGNTAAWQGLFHQTFDRWEELTGITYVHEPNDDGASLFGNQGQLAVRGDIRISAKPIDGGGGTLAYNFFPAGGGDMVIDAGDGFFNDTANNSLRLRNVIAHENGHGIGELHVCPILSQKLMEPFVSTAFDGPLHDDIRNAQDHYGDIFEPNDTAVIPGELGTVAAGTTLSPGAITNPSLGNASKLSIDEDDSSPFANDEDWYRFSTDGPGTFTVRMTPVGATYQDNPQSCSGQTADCCSGVFIDSLRLADLDLQLYDSAGFLLLETADVAGLGDFEEIAGWEVNGVETFQLRVYTSSDFFYEPQMYTLTIEAVPPPVPGDFGLLSPLNGATEVELGPVLDWEDSSAADTYLVEVDTDLFFGSPEVSQLVVAPASQLDLADGTLAGSTQHFWRVTAENEQGTTVSAPSLSAFTTAAPPATCVGDIDGDDDTDVFDFGIFSANFGQSVVPGTNGDLDGNGIVDVFDFAIFGGDFGCSG